MISGSPSTGVLYTLALSSWIAAVVPLWALSTVPPNVVEVLSVYVDMDVRKVVEFENEKANLINKFIEKNKKEFNPGELTLISKLKKSS